MKKAEKANLPELGKYIDPMSDFGFKRIFGSEPHKDLLISFLNELLNGRKIISELEYQKTENRGPRKGYKTCFYDVRCKGQDGSQFIIEVQRVRQKLFKERAYFYTSALVHELGEVGDDSDKDHHPDEVFFVGLMDFVLPESDPNEYIHWIENTFRSNRKVFFNKEDKIFIELPKFNKREDALESDLDRWLYVLGNMHQMDKISVYLRKPIFEKLFKIAEVAKLKKSERNFYSESLELKRNENQMKRTLIEEGKFQLIKNIHDRNNLTVTEIANFVGVTEDFVNEALVSVPV